MIDWDRILELQAEVGEEAIVEVIGIFLEEMGEGLDALTGLSDPRDIADKLHFLKGSAQNIGLTVTTDLCQRLEAEIRVDPSVRPDMPALRASLDDARGELTALAG